MSEAQTPTAQVRRIKRWRWVWLIPIVAVLFAVYLYRTHIVQYGPLITIRMSHGNGVKAGDVLRCRGIVVGAVEQVRLNDTLDGVVLHVRLAPEAKRIAVKNSRFWVERPRFGLTGVGGLETIAGPRYLVVVPGDGPPTKSFDALEQPPPVESIDPAGLHLTLKTDRRGSLRPGAPVTYRQLHVGTVLSVDLAEDSSHVRVEAYIQPSHTHLVRRNTKFWNVSGAGFHFGIKGLRFEVESLQTLLDGGIAFATPDDAGEPAPSGHTFELHLKADDDWLEWKPVLHPMTGNGG